MPPRKMCWRRAAYTYLKEGCMRVDPNELMKLLLKNGGRVRQTAREAGVSPSTVIFWRKRAKSIYTGKLCISGLKRRSTKPKATRSTTLTAKEQTEIKALHRQYGYGAAKLTKGIDGYHQTRQYHSSLSGKARINHPRQELPPPAVPKDDAYVSQECKQSRQTTDGRQVCHA